MTDRRTLLRALPALGAAAGAALVAAEAEAAIPATFEWTLREHLRCVQARDLAGLEDTLTNGDELLLILPNGVLTRTKADYLAFHRDWFQSTAWRIEFEELWVQTTLTIAQALFRTRYSDVMDDGSPYESRAYLMLTFKRDGARWRLWADQNTRIPAET